MELRFKDPKEFLYLSMWFVYSFMYTMNSSTFRVEFIFKSMLLCFMAVLALMFFWHNKMRLKNILLAVCFTVACLLIVRNSRKITLLINILFIINSDSAKFEKIIKVTFISVVASTALVILASQVGVIPDYIFYRKEDHRPCHSLGFGYYYNASAQAMFASILYMYMKKKVSWGELSVMVIISYLIYRKCTTRLPFIILLMAIAMYVILCKFNLIKTLNKSWIKFLAIIAYPLVFIVCSIFAINYDSSVKWKSKLNEALSDRVRLSRIAFKRYDVKLLGQHIEMKGHTYGENGMGSYFFIDSGYILSIIEYGLICTVFLLILYSYFYYYSCKVNDKRLFVWLSMVLVFNIVNGCWFSFVFNPIFFLIFHTKHNPIAELLNKITSGKINFCRE